MTVHHCVSPDRLLLGADLSSVVIRVLVAEDNNVNLAITREMLEIIGYLVDTVADGSEASAAAMNNRYGLILMDCQMPILDGYDATRQIRAAEREREQSRVPIIALTGNIMQGDREACLDAGMDDYLSKPFTMPQLAAVCAKWIST